MNPAHETIAAPLPDAAFAYAPGGSLMATTACDAHDAWRHLSSTVLRDPLDLEAHARRVLLACEDGPSGRAFTALVDLYLALGSRGSALRQRLLDHARPCLSPEDAAFFEQSFSAGALPSASLPIGTQSLLDPGLMGSPVMIAHTRQAVAEQTAAQRAAELVDQGDLAAARQLLEEAVMQDPDDLAAATELIGIYRYSRDAQAEQAMRDRITSRFGRTPAPWA
ncbi:MAG: hypothetical protein JNJ71_13625 [Rubrivivax sp.]|nr:hypothetical protein [Rubrivivax sp.]